MVWMTRPGSSTNVWGIVVYDMQYAQGDMAIATSTIPIVFALVTDPVAAGLVTDPNAPSGNITGASDHMPAQLHLDHINLDHIKELVPRAKRLGYTYNAGESNSVAGMEEEWPLAEAMGYQTVEATASNTNEVQQAMASLVGRVDVVALIQDNTVVSAFEAVPKVANQNNIPVITADIDSVTRGAAAGLGANGEIVGRAAGVTPAATDLASQAVCAETVRSSHSRRTGNRARHVRLCS